MEETRLFGYHIPMIIKSKCFERKAYPVHGCLLYHRWIYLVCVNKHTDKKVCPQLWTDLQQTLQQTLTLFICKSIKASYHLVRHQSTLTGYDYLPPTPPPPTPQKRVITLLFLPNTTILSICVRAVQMKDSNSSHVKETSQRSLNNIRCSGSCFP